MSVSNQINTIVECWRDQGAEPGCLHSHAERAFPRGAWERGEQEQSVGTREEGSRRRSHAERGNEGNEGEQKTRVFPRRACMGRRAFPRRAWERGKQEQSVGRGRSRTRAGVPTRSVGTRDPSDKCPAKAQNQNRFTTTPAVIAIWNRSWEMSLTFRMRAKRSNFSGTMIVSPGSSLVLEPLDISQR